MARAASTDRARSDAISSPRIRAIISSSSRTVSRKSFEHVTLSGGDLRSLCMLLNVRVETGLYPLARRLTLDAMLGDRHHGELRFCWGMGVPRAGDCEVASWFLVPGTGLEPVRPCGPSILSALCLPVSPPGQAIDCNGVGARHGAASGVHWDGGRGIASRGTLFARRRGMVFTRQPGSHGASFSNGAGSGHHPP